jgi:broad specificity phosphatase PhoE
MPTVTLLRHGQASFNSSDYDRLSDLGARQAKTLAARWLEQRTAFDRVYTGSLRRQIQTERELAAAFDSAGRSWPAPQVHPGLDEFPAERIVRKLGPELCLRDRQVRRLYRRYSRGGEQADEALMALVRRVCDYWVAGNYATPLSVRWPAFREQVIEVMTLLAGHAATGERVLAVTSGGVISVALQLAAGESADEAIARNWEIHNGSLTEFTTTGDGDLRIAIRASTAHLAPDLLTLR